MAHDNGFVERFDQNILAIPSRGEAIFFKALNVGKKLPADILIFDAKAVQVDRTFFVNSDGSRHQCPSASSASGLGVILRASLYSTPLLSTWISSKLHSLESAFSETLFKMA